MKLIQKLREIWSIEELRSRILLTLGLVLIYRLGTYITLPGIDPTALENIKTQGSSGILGLVNLFAGGAFARASVFALGIMPYISASIAIQLLTIAIPYFQKLQKEGELGRRKITQWTRYLTVLLALIQSFGIATALQSAQQGFVTNPGVGFVLLTMLSLTTGTAFIMWLGEQITERGLGNGISIIIFAGIVANLPGALASRLEAVQEDKDAQFQVGVEFAIEQCRDLLAGGVPGIHFYVLNRSQACEAILDALGVARR